MCLSAELSRALDSVAPSLDERYQHSEVSTPYALRQLMLDAIPSEFWAEPHRVLEPCCGKGAFVIDIARRFLAAGLSERTVLEDCIFFQDINADNVRATRALLDPDERYAINSRVGDALTIDWGHGFDAVIGNPPYNVNQRSRGNTPLYNLFIERYIDRCHYLLFVIPSRWFSGGKGLGRFRRRMLARRDIRLIEHVDDARVWFPTVRIQGGVHFFLKDSDYSGPCHFNGVPVDLGRYDCVVKPALHSVIDAVWHRPWRSLAVLAIPQSHFSIESNDVRLNASDGPECFVSLSRARRLGSEGRVAHVRDYRITDSCWKVITTSAAHSAGSGFGFIAIAAPNQIHSKSYISFRCSDIDEARSLLSYLQTDFANEMLAVRKMSQAVSTDTVRWIPLLPLDRIWTDRSVRAFIANDPFDDRRARN